MIKSEGLDAQKDIGYDDNGISIELASDKGNKGTNFPGYKPGLEKVFPGRPYIELSRWANPEQFKELVDDKLLKLLPSVQYYSSVLFRQVNSIDTSKFCDVMVNKVLKKRKNVQFLYESDVTGYEIDPDT